MKNEKVIGIDLGTTNSCISIIENGVPVVLVNKEGQRTTPSVVAYAENDVLIGSAAKRQFVMNPQNTISSIKKYMGAKYLEIDNNNENTYTLTNSGDTPVVLIGEDKLTPQEISAKVLIELKNIAENYYGEEIKNVVITCPAYFNDAQRKATKEAGIIAGLNVLRIINEPTAAALAYGFDKDQLDKNIAVYDAGGGTFDISILSISDGVFNVLSTAGDTNLGGDNFDDALYDYVWETIEKQTTISEHKFKNSPQFSLQTIARIKEACEKAKIDLSSSEKTVISLPFLFYNTITNSPTNFQQEINRSKFEELTNHLIERTLDCCREAIKKSKLNLNDIDEVIMVGGTTRIPSIQTNVKNFFGKNINNTVNPDEVVAIGAVIQAAILNGTMDDLTLLDVTPLTLGIETVGNEMAPIIQSNTTIPVVAKEIFSTSNDNQTSVEIHVLQGERLLSFNNKSLGKFILNDIPPMPRGIPQIEVSFEIDGNGILSVSAIELSTGTKQEIKIEAGSGLSNEEIERMKQNAIENQAFDDLKRSINKVTNDLETATYNIKKLDILGQKKEYNQWLAFKTESLKTFKETNKETLNHLTKVLSDYDKLMAEVSVKA